MPAVTDAIVAAASPPGPSRRAIVRLSGEATSPLAEALLDRRLEPRELTVCRLRLPSPHGRGWPEGPGEGTSDYGVNREHAHPLPSPPPKGEGVSLPVLAVYFPAPQSYTGADVLELQLPGNPALLERVLHHVIAVGASVGCSVRLAEPGEFTQRAFLAGRIDLTQAEGIAATIGAMSDAQLQAASLLRVGRLGRWSTELVDQLAQLLALVEAGIDFIDQDDVVAVTPADLDAGLQRIESQLAGLLSRSRSWAALEHQPWVVLVGSPNVGKSTLFNALLGHERAVTSPVAGTTRDVLAEPMRVEHNHREVELMLVDIAGLDDPANALDRCMQSAAHEAIRRAELVLALTDQPTATHAGAGVNSSSQIYSNVLENLRIDLTAPILRIGTKSDIVTHTNVDLAVSAVTGEGLDRLRRLIAQHVGNRAASLSGQMLALQPRHRSAITAAQQAIGEARRLVEPQRDSRALADMELIAAAMRAALDHLGELGGRMSPDDVIGRIFATFCIGK